MYFLRKRVQLKSLPSTDASPACAWIFCTCFVFTVLVRAEFHDISLFSSCNLFFNLVVIANVIIIIALAKEKKGGIS